MAASAGTSPWNRPKGVIWGQKNGLEYDLAAGWHAKRQEGWTELPSTKRRLVATYDLRGKKHKLYAYDTPDTIVGFQAHEDDHAARQKLLAEAENAFDYSRADKGNIIYREGCGHISSLEYAAKEHILRVEFWNDDVCIFKDVPTFVAGTLLEYARTKALASPAHYYYGKQYRERHKLGVEFWQMIRIPGHHTGAKFPFEYESHGSYAISHGHRHIVKTGEGKNYMVSYNDEEWAAYQDAMDVLNKLHHINKKVSRSKTASAHEVEDEANLYEQNESVGLDENLTLEDGKWAMDAQERINQMQQAVNNSSLGRLLTKVQNMLNATLNSSAFQKLYGDIAGSDKESAEARKALIANESQDYPELALMDMRTGKMKNISGVKDLAKYREQLAQMDTEGTLSWLRPNDRYRNIATRLWSKQELIDIGNPYVPGNLDQSQARQYRVYIENEDWEGALRFLKGAKKRGQFYTDTKSGTKEPKEAETFAGQTDKLLMDFGEDKED